MNEQHTKYYALGKIQIHDWVKRDCRLHTWPLWPALIYATWYITGQQATHPDGCSQCYGTWPPVVTWFELC